MVAGVTRIFRGETQGLCSECQKNFVRNGDKCVFCAMSHKERILKELEESFSLKQKALFAEYRKAEKESESLRHIM